MFDSALTLYRRVKIDLNDHFFLLVKKNDQCFASLLNVTILLVFNLLQAETGLNP